MTRRLTVLVGQIREVMKAEIKGYKSSPGPKGQTCPSCEYGEQFGDEDDKTGWCRRWDRDVTRSAWCESWTRSTRLDTPEIPVNDSPERVKEKPKEAPAKPAAKGGGKFKGGGGGGGFKKKKGGVRPPLQQTTVGGVKPPVKPVAKVEPEA